MGMSWEDVVLIEKSKNSGDSSVVITVNCPDKAGLGCDLLRIVLEFGLYVTRGGILCFEVSIFMLFLVLGFMFACEF